MAQSITSITQVELHFVGGTTHTHMVPTSEIAPLVEASKQLHHSPGLNPHNRREAAKIWKISSRSLHVGGPYWWSTPGLQENGDPAGARVIQWDLHERIIFVDEESDEYRASQRAQIEEDETQAERLDAGLADA